MTKPWTYLSLKAVFQYMDVNKRLQVNSHCPALRSAESSVPLSLQSLTLNKRKIVANDVCYKVESKSQRIKSILDGRKHVRVEILKIRNSSVIPDRLKFRTRNLDFGNLNLEKVPSFINRASFPLRELRVNISKTPNLEKHLRCTQALVLFETNLDQEKSDWIRSVLYDRKGPNIVLENFILSSEDTIALIQNWRNHHKDIGTVLTIHHEYGVLPLSNVAELMDVFNGRNAYFNDSVLQLEINFHCPGLRSAESSVPLNLQSLILTKRKIVPNDVCYKVESKYQRIKSILDGRKHVRVEFLKIRNSRVIPDSLKIRTRSLDSGDLNLERVLPFIDKSSFPLRELRVNIAKTPNLERYLGCTQTLILFETKHDRENVDLIRTILYDRKSSNIVLENISLSSNDTVALIQNWRNNQKKIGTVLTMQNRFRIIPIVCPVGDEFPYVNEILRVSNGTHANFNDSVLQNNMDRRCISFPFNETSELVLYSVRDEPIWNRRIKLEVMPIGSTGPETLFDIFIDLLVLLSYIFLLLIALIFVALASAKLETMLAVRRTD
ncbi:hypothetical protein GCK72_007276 [Caenorhabditis remanei]|uniref:Uncharacterized protein n=1 Tax=Caenorhabditis remanei TaxID=31234 RepID=A0A6A5HLG2_CAERE|nr:hypothetical protein GCK72_007276 [Caenorhabditis remanei]KAF1767317.1 hypothetical protein GCK72_007276 [Caenorhabditis remanei]